MDTLAKSEAYIKLKDHKDNFERNIPCRLINPAKSEIGRVSKNMLNSILATVRERTGVNQWRSTDETLNWFDGLSNKTNLTFLTFDIVEFYPSVTEPILRKALEFAQEHTTIKDIEIDAILNARQTLMFTKGKMWSKRNASNCFDVAMGSYDGAEICELVGLFVLDQLK